ncbi:MAG: hypothetical protein ACI9CO_000353 [Candidatus Azotimanducaceae bacterium]|jgi:hypothetical protein
MIDSNIFNTEEDISIVISKLKERVSSIESVCGHSLRTVQIRNEISRREALLVYNNPRVRSVTHNVGLI